MLTIFLVNFGAKIIKTSFKNGTDLRNKNKRWMSIDVKNKQKKNVLFLSSKFLLDRLPK